MRPYYEASNAFVLDRLALALHEEQADRQGGCGNHTESYDDHMEWHRYVAERLIVRSSDIARESR